MGLGWTAVARAVSPSVADVLELVPEQRTELGTEAGGKEKASWVVTAAVVTARV